ncbi:MAG: DUF177 domain-containing protein [Bacteroidales bacterium]|nr:DUF177 domain-containing protein [Bacteroidales bacterium]MBN2821232.1 DUF177 domain-containing protein [Bacteroidales bacterium]
MKVEYQYIIPFKGLKEESHYFDFTFEKEFFELNSALEVTDGNLSAQVILTKKSSFLELRTTISGVIKIQCDRCLENFDYNLNYSGKLFVKFKEEAEEPDNEMIYLHPSEDMLDLNQYFYDCIGLSIPLQKFHPDDEFGNIGCDEKMINIIQSHSIKDSIEDNNIDPRWSKLKDLLDEGNKNE